MANSYPSHCRPTTPPPRHVVGESFWLRPFPLILHLWLACYLSFSLPLALCNIYQFPALPLEPCFSRRLTATYKSTQCLNPNKHHHYALRVIVEVIFMYLCISLIEIIWPTPAWAQELSWCIFFIRQSQIFSRLPKLCLKNFCNKTNFVKQSPWKVHVIKFISFMEPEGFITVFRIVVLDPEPDKSDFPFVCFLYISIFSLSYTWHLL